MIDNQIIYPHVFFESDYSILDRHTLDYRKCFTLLRTHLNLVILPENTDEFNVFILKKFRKFLDEIDIVAGKVASRGQSIETFEKAVWQAIKLSNFGDFEKYWEVNKDRFRTWLSLDKSSRENEKFRLVANTLERYKGLTEDYQQEWEEKDKQVCLGFYKCFKENRQNRVLPSKVDDRDLQILSGCLAFVCSYLPDGKLYLVTGDNAFYKTAEMVVNAKIPLQKRTLRLCGFGVKKPLDILHKFSS